MSEPSWLTIALSDLGIREIKGPKHNPKVLDYFKDVGRPDIKNDETAWCAAGLGSWLKRAGLAIPPPQKALAAISYETWGERLEQPALGAIGVKRRPGEAWQRHTGLIVAANATTIWMVSANSSNSVNIAPYSRWQFTALRWPEGQPRTDARLPANAPGKAGSEA